MNGNPSQSPGKNGPSDNSRWDALFLKRTEQTAFSTLWVAVVLGCLWYFVTARGTDLIDIDKAPTRTARYLVQINTASKHEFACLPGIGPKTASKITHWRKENGPFETVDSMADVPGVSAKMIEKLRPFLYTGNDEDVTQR